MADGDIISAIVSTDGCTLIITIEGVSPGGTYDFNWGAGNNVKSLSDRPAIRLQVDRVGFSAAGALTVTGLQDVYGGNIMEQPASPFDVQEIVSGDDLIIFVSATEPIFDLDDADGLDSSGWEPIITIREGLYTEPGPGVSSAAYTSTVTSQLSALDYPHSYAQWDWYAGVNDGDRIEADLFTVACNARHPFGIACVKFTATGLTSAVSVTQTITTETERMRPATGLYNSAFEAVFDATVFNDGEKIRVDYIAYPKVGNDANRVVSDTTPDATLEIGGQNSMVLYNDPDSSDSMYAYVDSAGSDPGTVDADPEVAALDPFATPAAAWTAGANRIIVNEGTFSITGSAAGARRTLDTTKGKVLITPSGTKANTILKFPTQASGQTAYKLEKLELRGVTIRKDTKDSYLNGEGLNSVYYRNSHFDDVESLILDNIPITYNSLGSYFINNTGDLGRTAFSLQKYDAGGAVPTRLHLDGNIITNAAADNGNAIQWVYRFVANHCYGPVQLVSYAGDVSNPATDGYLMIESNHWESFDGTTIISFRDTVSVGYAVNNNVFEWTGIPENPMLFFWAEYILEDVNGLMAYNNTLAGERGNMCYNDPLVDTDDGPWDRTNIYIRFNLWEEIDFKGYEFTGNETHIGTIPVRFGCGISDNQFQHTKGYHGGSTLLGNGGFDGVNVWVGADQDEPSPFVDDRSFTGTGTGGGDYRPNTDASAYQGARANQWQLPFDILGNPRNPDGDHMGAYAYVDADGAGRTRSNPSSRNLVRPYWSRP